MAKNISNTKLGFMSSTKIFKFFPFVLFLYPLSFLVVKQETFRPTLPPLLFQARAKPEKKVKRDCLFSRREFRSAVIAIPETDLSLVALQSASLRRSLSAFRKDHSSRNFRFMFV